jgi:hypothetical protein
MTGFVKKGGIWVPITQPKVKVGGVWTDASRGLVKKGGTWEEWFSAAPAAAPLQVVDLQIVDYRRNGTAVEVDLAWTHAAGTTQYDLYVFRNTSLIWLGAPVNGDGTGGERDFVPTETLTNIANVGGTFTYTNSNVGTNVLLVFRLLPKNAIGSASFPSNAPWITARTDPSDIPLPTPLPTGPITWSGNSGLSTPVVNWTAPTINVGEWQGTYAGLLLPRNSVQSPRWLGSYVAAPGLSGSGSSITYPYGVVVGAPIVRGVTAGGAVSGCVYMDARTGNGFTRVPYTRYNTTQLVVAGTDTYEGGSFPDIGYKFYNQDTNPVIIGSCNPTTMPDGTTIATIRGGQVSCAYRVQYSRTVDAASIYCMGYGDLNEYARYLHGPWASASDIGDSRYLWTWSNNTDPIWGFQNGLTYNMYIN